MVLSYGTQTRILGCTSIKEKVMATKALKILEERLKKNHDLKAEYLKEKQKLKLERERRQFMKGEAYYLSIQYSRRMARELDEDDRDSL